MTLIRFIVLLFCLGTSACAGASISSPSPQPTSTPTSFPPPPPSAQPTLAPGSQTAQDPPSRAGRWILVSLAEQQVYLRDGDKLVAQHSMSSGVGNSSETSTPPGDYAVHSMWRGPEETVTGVYVRDIVLFDPERGNGFHSMPMDKDGKVLDATLGRPATAGCIRLAQSNELFEFARIGMPVIIR